MCTIAVLAACISPYTEDDEGEIGLPGRGTPIEVSSLFEPLEDDFGSGFKFYTNNPGYRTQWGYTLWAYNSVPSGVFSERTVVLSKPTGDNIAGYGAIICSAQREIEGRMKTVFLTVMINNNGQYAVGKVIEGLYISLEKWKPHVALNKGSGLINRIKIEKDSVNGNRYNLYFNNFHNPVADFFVDSLEPICESYGRNGYLVVISPDDLNGSAVEVYFYE